KEDKNYKNGQRAADARRRKMVQKSEQQFIRIIGHLAQCPTRRSAVKPDCAVPEYRHPQKIKSCGDDQHRTDKLSDCPSIRYFGNKESDIRGAGNPPSPI